jgi:N-acetylglucosaminyldiphosphoundecaprenol N-acetyl-beta-D-mannosaminyltransferase
LAEKLRSEMPWASFVIPPFLQMGELEKFSAVAEEIREVVIKNRINYVFMGISDPKQGLLVKKTVELLQGNKLGFACAFFSLGASYEFYFGMKKRAPEIFRKTVMEWFYRLVSEPKRMFKRYVFGNFSFIAKSLRWVFSSKGKKRG